MQIAIWQTDGPPVPPFTATFYKKDEPTGKTCGHEHETIQEFKECWIAYRGRLGRSLQDSTGKYFSVVEMIDSQKMSWQSNGNRD